MPAYAINQEPCDLSCPCRKTAKAKIARNIKFKRLVIKNSIKCACTATWVCIIHKKYGF